MEKISPTPFYTEWKGHTNADLKKLFANTLLLRDEKPIVWLAGDSSLDNKAWISADGAGGVPLPVSIPDYYTHVLKALTPMKPDVAFWMNYMLGDSASVINGAIESSQIRERKGRLLVQELVIRDNIRPQDILVISLGAHDLALSPGTRSTFHLRRLVRFSSQAAIADGSAWPLSHFRKLLGTRIEKHIDRLTANTRPAAVLVCAPYFPLEATLAAEPGWADDQLRALKYDTQPQKLQAIIRVLYEQAVCKIQVPGSTVVAVPLFEALDGKNAGDYVERVEPGVEGGRKIAKALAKVISPLLNEKEPFSLEMAVPDARADSHSNGNALGKDI